MDVLANLLTFKNRLFSSVSEYSPSIYKLLVIRPKLHHSQQLGGHFCFTKTKFESHKQPVWLFGVSWKSLWAGRALQVLGLANWVWLCMEEGPLPWGEKSGWRVRGWIRLQTAEWRICVCPLSCTTAHTAWRQGTLTIPHPRSSKWWIFPAFWSSLQGLQPLPQLTLPSVLIFSSVVQEATSACLI